jgi:hypothetical protein
MKTPVLITIFAAFLTLPLMACKDSAEARKKAQEEEAVNKIYGSLTSSKIKGHENDKTTKNGK